MSYSYGMYGKSASYLYVMYDNLAYDLYVLYDNFGSKKTLQIAPKPLRLTWIRISRLKSIACEEFLSNPLILKWHEYKNERKSTHDLAKSTSGTPFRQRKAQHQDGGRGPGPNPQRSHPGGIYRLGRKASGAGSGRQSGESFPKEIEPKAWRKSSCERSFVSVHDIKACPEQSRRVS